MGRGLTTNDRSAVLESNPVRHRSRATHSRQPRQVRKEATVTGSCVCSGSPVPDFLPSKRVVVAVGMDVIPSWEKGRMAFYNTASRLGFDRDNDRIITTSMRLPDQGCRAFSWLKEEMFLAPVRVDVEFARFYGECFNEVHMSDSARSDRVTEFSPRKGTGNETKERLLCL